jgi:N-acetylglucosamine-6-sulfatase
MNRRAFMGTSAGATAGVLLTKVPASAEQTPQVVRPNVICIVADDLDARLIDLAASIPDFMPKYQELMVARGTTFTRAYVSSPLCTPSRASILTGRYPHNTGVVDNDYGLFYPKGEEETVATMLQAAGYVTILLGKYMNGYGQNGLPDAIPPGWSEWYAVQETGRYWDYRINANGVDVFHPAGPEQNYVTDVLGRYAVDFVMRMARRFESCPSAGGPAKANERKPFFVHVGLIAPHKPAEPAPRHAELFPNASAPRVPSFDEEDVSDKPEWVRRRPRLKEDPEVLRIVERLYRRRLRTMMAVDDLFRDLIQALQDTNQLANTIIVSTSDNGWQTGEHRYGEGKALMYEESIRMPLVIRGPEIPAGATLRHLVSNVDFLPTWLELAGAPIARNVEGRSLAPLLREHPVPAEQWRNELLVEYLVPGGSESPPFRQIRTDRYSYAEYEGGEREVYDMERDEYQLENIARTAPQSVLVGLSRRLQELAHCAGRSCQ